MGPRFVLLAAAFYGALTVLAALWTAFRGRDLPLLGDSAALGVSLGLLTAAGTVASGLAAYRLLPMVRGVAEELAPRLVDGASGGALLLVALLSGVGEEALFRGAVQQEFGLVAGAVAFGLAHVGPDRRYLLWTAWAAAVGLLFGALFEATGGLLAPVLAHAAHNAATLLLWKRARNRRVAG